jgi:hypothetical protein
MSGKLEPGPGKSTVKAIDSFNSNPVLDISTF